LALLSYKLKVSLMPPVKEIKAIKKQGVSHHPQKGDKADAYWNFGLFRFENDGSKVLT
jgi:hypothetical protein